MPDGTREPAAVIPERSPLGRLEDEINELRGAAEAVGVLADRTAHHLMHAPATTGAGLGETITGEALAWAVRELQRQVDAVDHARAALDASG